MAETPIRFGVLGCADIARKVSRAINLAPNASLYAVASRTLDKAQKFAIDNGFPPSAKIYGSYEALLDDPDVDAVYLPLPTSLHVRWAVLVAEKKKHVLLEKPVALNVQEFDRIIAACDLNGVQLMDGTMWMHHPRTAMMREILSDSLRFGQLKSVHSFFSFAANPDFLKNDIRVKPDLDGLGALGDVGWYCIRSILWVVDYELPKAVTALRGPVFNESGVILSCGASLHWEDGKVATFQCSFITNLTMDITAVGTKGTLHLNDFVVPFEETSASFTLASESGFTDLVTGWNPMPSEHVVTTDLPQEARLVMEFASLVRSIKESGSKPENKWPVISRKTQLVLDAVKASIDKGFMPIEIDYSIKLDELNSQFVVSNTCNGEGGEAGVHEWVRIDELNSPHLNILNSGVDEMNSLAAVSEMGVEEMKQQLVESNTGGDTEEEHRTDVSEHFITDLVFESRQHLLDWCQDIGRRIKLAVVIRKSEKPAPRRSGRLVLGCERSGRYRKNPLKKDKTDKDYRETGTKKCNCPFQLKGIPLPGDKWKLEVVCGYHNHPITESLVWHSSAGRLNREEEEFVIDLLKSGVKARDVLVELKQRSETNVSNLKTIYNARNRLRLLAMEGSSAIKELDMEETQESSNSVKPGCRRRKYKSRRKVVTSTICSS